MNKTIKFTLVTLWILFSRSFDAFSTNRYTPDLSAEANPLVSVFGMEWTPLLTIVGLVTFYAIYTYYLTVFRPMSLLPKERGYSLGNFIAYIYLGKNDHWTAIFYKFPKDLNRFHHYIGQTLSRALVIVGVISTTMWLLMNYTDFYKEIHSVTLVYTLIVLGIMWSMYYWSLMQYKVYVEQQRN